MKRNVSEKSFLFSHPIINSNNNNTNNNSNSNNTNKMMNPKSKSRKMSNCFEYQNKQRSFETGSQKKRFLITVNVLGSPGPLRFLVNEEDLVCHVIDMALKVYAKEGRLPLMGSSNPNNFSLFRANLGSDAMSSWDEIRCCGARNFVLCKKAEQQGNMTEARSEMFSRKRSSNVTWKAWLNKSLSFQNLASLIH